MMWPFSRRRDPGREVPAGPVLRQTVAVQPWRDAPAMTPSVTPIPLTLAPERFAEGLSSWQQPQPYLAPLGHVVSPEAPSGAVGGLTHTVQRVAQDDGGPSLVLRQTQPPEPVVQRSFAQPSRPLLGSVPAAAPTAAPAADAAPATAPATTGTTAAPELPAAPAMPLRTVPVVASPPPVTVSRFTTGGAVDTPTLHLPVAPARAADAPAEPPASAPPDSEAPPETAAPLLDGQAVVPPVGDTSPASTDQVVQRAAEHPADAALPLATPPSPSPPPAPRPSGRPAAPDPGPALPPAPAAPLVGGDAGVQRRKLGLGEPLHERPASPPPPSPPQAAAGAPPAAPLPLQRRPESPAPSAPVRPAPTLGLGPPLGSSAPRPSDPPDAPGAAPTAPLDVDQPSLPPLAAPPSSSTSTPLPSAGEIAVPPPDDSPAVAEPTVQRSPVSDEPTLGPPLDSDSVQPPTTAPLLGTVLPPVVDGPPPDTGAPAGPSLPLQRSVANGHDTPAPGTGAPTLSPAGAGQPGATAPTPTPPSTIQRAIGGAPLTLAGLPALGGPRQVAPLLGRGGLAPVVPPRAAVLRASAAAGPSAAGPAVSRPPVGHVQARPLDVPATAGPTALLEAAALPAVLRESHAGSFSGGVTGAHGDALRTLPVAHATSGGAAVIQRAVGGLATPAPFAAPATPHDGSWRTGPGAAALAAPAAAPIFPLRREEAATPPRAAATSSPLALQRSEPAAPPQQESLGLESLFSQGAAQPDGPNGISFPQGVRGGGDGQAPAAPEQGAAGGEDAAGEGGGSHPRDWDAKTIEELSRRLYAGISRRIKQELRTDRERTGRLMDLRR